MVVQGNRVNADITHTRKGIFMTIYSVGESPWPSPNKTGCLSKNFGS